MRRLILVTAVLTISGCAVNTPTCSDEAVTAEIVGRATDAIASGLLENDAQIRTGQIMDRITVALTDVTTTDHDAGIDKHSCSAVLRVTLPAEIARLNEHRAFQVLALRQTRIPVEGNDIVAPVSYTTYLSEREQQLIIRSEGEKLPATYIQAAHKIGAFDAGLGTLDNLHGGLTLYSAPGKNLLIEPGADGSLQFQISHERNQCRSWTQVITEERGDRLIYDNPEVGCSLLFSRLGDILLVEHKGCEMMPQTCLPDGIYQRQ